jgi:hypothetical protein
MNFIVGFSKPKKFNIIAKLIMIVEGTPFNHVYIEKYSSYLERNMIYEATIHGVSFKKKELLLERAEIIEEYEYDLTEEDNKLLLQSIYDNVGKEYGFKQLLGNLFIRLGLWVRNKFADDEKKLVCLEAVGNLLKILNIVKKDINFENLGLKEIHTIIQETGKRI